MLKLELIQQDEKENNSNTNDLLEILQTKKPRHKRERNLFVDATNQQDYADLNADEKLIAEESERDCFKDIILSDERLFENDNLEKQEIPCRNCLVYFEDCKCRIFVINIFQALIV